MKPTNQAHKPTKHTKIVLIEDEDSLRFLYMTKFRQSGFEIFDANGGKDGLALVHEKKPDVILLDILMPHMNGYEVMEALASDKDDAIRSIPVIFLTNLAEDAGLAKAHQMGVASYVVKASRSPDELVHLVKAVLSTTQKGPHG